MAGHKEEDRKDEAGKATPSNPFASLFDPREITDAGRDIDKRADLIDREAEERRKRFRESKRDPTKRFRI